MARERWFARGFLSLAALAALAVSFVIPSSAQGGQNGWRLCNRTSYVIEAATGRPESDNVIVEGRTRLRPGQCEIAVPGPIQEGAHYVYARSSKAHRGGQSWTGPTRNTTRSLSRRE